MHSFKACSINLFTYYTDLLNFRSCREIFLNAVQSHKEFIFIVNFSTEAIVKWIMLRINRLKDLFSETIFKLSWWSLWVMRFKLSLTNFKNNFSLPPLLNLLLHESRAEFESNLCFTKKIECVYEFLWIIIIIFSIEREVIINHAFICSVKGDIFTFFWSIVHLIVS